MAMFGALALCALPAFAGASQWGRSVSPHGAEIAYPESMFSEVDNDNDRANAYASRDGAAKFVLGSWFNDAEETPAEFKEVLTDKGQLYADVTYAPKGRDWFVLSGYRGGDVYYEKIMFSCNRRLVNVYAISYPSADRDRYDSIVERMENSFKPGQDC